MTTHNLAIDRSMNVHRTRITRRVRWSARVGVAAATLTLAGGAASPARVTDAPQIVVGAEPVIVEVSASAHPSILFGQIRTRHRAADDLARPVIEAAAANPGRLVALKLTDLPLQFEKFSPGAAAIVGRSLGQPDDAAAAYEQALASLLGEVISRARAGGAQWISIIDMPATESRDAGDGFRRVVDELDALVSSQFFILSKSASEQTLLDRALPTMLDARAGRPLFYRANWVWRALLDPAWLREDPARISMLHRAGLDNVLLREDPSLRGTWEVAHASGDLGTAGSASASGATKSGTGTSSGSSASKGSSGGSSGGGRGSGGSGRDGDDSTGGDPGNEPLPPLPPGPKRLLHFQQVGWSIEKGIARVHPSVCSAQLGWQENVNRTLQPLVTKLGPDAFDWWGHWTAGIWAHDNWINDPYLFGPWWGGPVFEAPEYAAVHFPKLVDYGPLAAFASANGIKLYGYTGFARDYQSPRWSVVHPEHSRPEHFMRWYGPFVEAGFVGLGHDWTGNAPETSGLLTYNFPTLRGHGIEPFVEAMPDRSNQYMLGQSVVAFETRWIVTESRPDRFFSDAEIRAAGGRTIHIVHSPPDNYDGDRYEWIWNRSVALLREGKTVAVNLGILDAKGFPIRELVRYSRQ